MTNSEKKKLIATNVAIWAAAMMAAFVLPMIAESMTDGKAAFLKMMVYLLPMILAMLVSTVVINKAIDEPDE